MAALGDQDDSLHGLGTEGHARRMQMEKWRADQGGKRPHSYSVGPAMTWRPGGPRRRSKSRLLGKQPSIVGLFTKKSAMTNLPGRYCPVPMAFAAGRSVRCLRLPVPKTFGCEGNPGTEGGMEGWGFEVGAEWKDRDGTNVMV